MRPALVALLLIAVVTAAAVGCGKPLPPPPPALAMALRGKVEVDVHVQAQAQVQVATPPVAVALEGAAVVEFFGIPLDGATEVTFVLDRSGSMAEPAPGVPPRTKMDLAHHELTDALARLPDGTRTNIIFFNETLRAVAATPVVLDATNRPAMVEFVRNTGPAGSTALATALRAAFLMDTRRIVLLSDGLGNVGGDAGVVLRDAREAIRGGVRIDTIGIGVNQDRPLLDALARESGGLYQAL